MPNEFKEVFPEKHGYVLSVDELSKLDELLKDGLIAVTICQHGIGRSFGLAEIFSELGFPSMFIEGGFEEISGLSSEKQGEVALKLAKVPHVVASLTDEEKRDFRPQIELINSKRKEHVFVHNSDADALPNLLKKLIEERK